MIKENRFNQRQNHKNPETNSNFPNSATTYNHRDWAEERERERTRTKFQRKREDLPWNQSRLRKKKGSWWIEIYECMLTSLCVYKYICIVSTRNPLFNFVFYLKEEKEDVASRLQRVERERAKQIMAPIFLRLQSSTFDWLQILSFPVCGFITPNNFFIEKVL